MNDYMILTILKILLSCSSIDYFHKEFDCNLVAIKTFENSIDRFLLKDLLMNC